MRPKPRLLILSHVLPTPPTGGQRLRVHYTLKALASRFDLTLLTSVAEAQIPETREMLAEYEVEPILLRKLSGNLWHKGRAALYGFLTGLKRSNYYIGALDFEPERVRAALEGRAFDAALFEYWHAHACIDVMREKDMRCVLDMHNVLWQSLEEQLANARKMPAWWKRHRLDRYRRFEEAVWNRFDALVAINSAEYAYVKQQVAAEKKLFYAPMGTDLQQWVYSWAPTTPPRFAYYGGLGRPQNERGALQCYHEIMPRIWEEVEDAELWLVGNGPTERLQALARDKRVTVTGFVEEVAPLLSTMTAVLCPWEGTFGFRSRLVEVMALGVPVVASPDAVYGMDLTEGEGLHLGHTLGDLAEKAWMLAADAAYGKAQSEAARKQIVHRYSLEATYERLADDLLHWITRSAPTLSE